MAIQLVGGAGTRLIIILILARSADLHPAQYDAGALPRKLDVSFRAAVAD